MSQQSFHQQTANGSNIAFTITTFSEDEIKVYVDGVESTNGGSSQNDYTIPNYTISGGTVTWNTSGSLTAPASPSIVRVVRQTDVMNNGNTAVEGKATYTAGSSVKADDLNNNTKQALRAIKEQQDQLIQTYDIEDKAVTRDKIALDAIDGTRIADDAVDSEHIAADSLDTEHYAPGSIDATAIGTNAVTTDKILNDNVTMDKLGSGALPTDITVSTDNIVNGTIQTADIGGDQITNALIADDQIDSEHYVDGSIDTQHLAPDAIDGTRIADESINSEHYVDGSIDREHLAADIVDGTKIADDSVDSEHIAAGALDNEHYGAGSITSDKLTTATVITASEQATATANDTSFFTSAAAEAAFLRQDSSETIASGDTWSGVDSKVATTKAIDLRIIDLVDDVGGFVPIADELSFPNENPDINDPDSGGTIVSIRSMDTSRTPINGTVTITNGTVGNSTVTISNCGTTVLAAGFGVLVETTSVLNTYHFHRLVPKATEVSTVAANVTAIAAAGNNVTDINNFADLYQISQNAPTARADSSSLQVGDLWFDSSSNKVMMVYDASSGDGFTAVTPNASDLANINIVAGQLVFQEDLGLITDAVSTGTGNQTLNTVAGIASNVTTVAGIASNVTTVANDATDIGAVAGKATEIGRLGTADAVADMAILGTTDVVADLNTLATSAIVSDLDTLADISTNITTVAGISSDVTAVANDATDIGAVAGKATEIGRLGTADAVADMAILGTTAVVADMAILATTDVVADMNTLATADIVADMNLLGTADVVADMALLATTDVIADMALLATTDVIADMALLGTSDVVADMALLAVTDVINDMNTLATSANVTAMSTCATNITDINTFANRYRIDSSEPSTSLDVGDLYFDTSQNELRVYNGSAWQGGVTATGNLLLKSGGQMTGNITFSGSQTVDGRDLSADGTKLDGIETGATADQTAEEIQDIVGAMLSGNTETGITVTYQDADGTIDFVVASQTDENFTTADHAKLDGIEASATADQTAAEIRTLVESASDSNVFTDADHTKLNGIEASATADQTASEIVALIAGQTIAPNVITTTNLTLDFGSIA